MPWRESSAVDERVRFVAAEAEQEVSMAALCRAFGISRTTGYKWLRRHAAEGAAGLVERSRAPRQHPHALTGAMEERIVAARAVHPTWGARKLRAWLGRDEELASVPAASTIGEVLRRAGLLVPRRRRSRTPVWVQPLARASDVNAVWTADFKGQFRVGDGQLCYPLTIADLCSRYLVRCQGMASIDGVYTRALFEAAFREYGLPLVLRTDNGWPFASHGIGGLTALSIWCIKLGITPERIAPGHPEQNGQHERMHRTLKHETATEPFGPAASLRAQQELFERFRTVFNNERPHEALDFQTPASRFVPSPRPYPDRLPEVDNSQADLVRRVRSNGEIKWRGHLLYIGAALEGEHIGLTALSDRYWQVSFGPITLGVIDDAKRCLLPGQTSPISVNDVAGPKC